jgi:predicted nuclease with RNAse H fold
MSDAAIVIGIDVAAARPSTAVAVRAGRAAQVVEWMEADHGDSEQVAALMAWIVRHKPAVVAVDAPQDYRRPKRRAADSRSQDGRRAPASRACDRELLARRISVYQVPAKEAVDVGEARLPEWMRVGFDYFRRLRRLGFEIPDDAVMPGMLGGPPAVLEIYPHGAFAAVLGGLPPKKTTRAGLHMRVLALRRAGLEWDEYFDHDSLDALAAALTAWRFLQGRATPLGDPREGLIWLPVPPAEVRATYAPL